MDLSQRRWRGVIEGEREKREVVVDEGNERKQEFALLSTPDEREAGRPEVGSGAGSR